MALIKITKMYKVEVFENGERCTCSHGNDYATTIEEAKLLGMEILNDSRCLDYVSNELKKGDPPPIIYHVPRNL